MNALVTAEPSERQAIEASLDTILRAITDHDRERQDALPLAKPRIFSAADLVSEARADAQRTPAARYTRRLAPDPVRAALKHAVRQIGQRLYEIGGMEALQDACERVADLDPANWGTRTDIIDKTWDGIGDWFA